MIPMKGGVVLPTLPGTGPDATSSDTPGPDAQHVGVPASLVTSTDFIMVRAALVRFLGGANEAILWCRIHYRGHRSDEWWTATLDDLAEETGLSNDQVQRTLKKLLELGVLEREKLRAGGISDHTYSYRVLVRENDVAESRDHHVAESRDLPPVKKNKTQRDTRARATAISDDWGPNHTHFELGQKRGVNVGDEAMKFRAHALANDRRLVRWDQGFTNWLLNARAGGVNYAPDVSRETRDTRTNGQKAVDLARSMAEAEFREDDGRPW